MSLLIFGEWKSAHKEPPTEDGMYLVLDFFRGDLSYGASIDYTVKYGWNTTEFNHDHPINYATRPEAIWTTVMYATEETTSDSEVEND